MISVKTRSKQFCLSMIAPARKFVLFLVISLCLILIPGSMTVSTAYAEEYLADWPGTYEGRNDGRKARLTVSIAAATGNAMFYNLVLEDLDRGIVFRGQDRVKRGNQTHRMDDVKLESEDGQVKNIGQLFLHTWDTDHISGFTKWQGKNYGLAFSRAGIQSMAVSGHTLDEEDGRCQWIGIYQGRNDGRRARLTIKPLWQGPHEYFQLSRYQLKLEDLDRDVTFQGTKNMSTDPPHVLKNLKLESDDGQVKEIGRLFLHTWDTNYISGFTEWNGNNFGLTFSQSSPNRGWCEHISDAEQTLLIGEADKVAVRQPVANQWHTVLLNHSYDNPVVIMGPLSYNGSDPAVIRVRNVRDDRFEFKVDEWDYLDGTHIAENVSYLVVEAGEHQLDVGDAIGNLLKAGHVTVDHDWKNISFVDPLHREVLPLVVLSQVQSNHGGDVVVTRHKGVFGTTGFSIRLQEAEVKGEHLSEQVGWVAVDEVSSEGFQAQIGAFHESLRVGSDWRHLEFSGYTAFDDPPIFLADIESFSGGDTAWLRYQNLSTDGVELFVEEEQSADPETRHRDERIGHVILDPGPIYRFIASDDDPEPPPPDDDRGSPPPDDDPEPQGRWYHVRCHCNDGNVWAYVDAEACAVRDTRAVRVLTCAIVGDSTDSKCSVVGAEPSASDAACYAKSGNVRNIRLAE